MQVLPIYSRVILHTRLTFQAPMRLRIGVVTVW